MLFLLCLTVRADTDFSNLPVAKLYICFREVVTALDSVNIYSVMNTHANFCWRFFLTGKNRIFFTLIVTRTEWYTNTPKETLFESSFPSLKTYKTFETLWILALSVTAYPRT